MLPKGKIMVVNLLFDQCLVFCPFWSFYHHQWVWLTISFFAVAVFLPPQYSSYLYISSISLSQSVGRFIKIVLKISLFYIYRRHSNRKPERSWNKHNIMVLSNSRPHIQIMNLTLEASQMQRIYVKLLETSMRRRTPFIEEVSQRCDAARIPKTAFDGDDPSLILTIWGCVRKNQKCNFFCLSSIVARIFQ